MAQSPADYTTIGLLLIVRDLEKSTRFYCEGLGYTQGQTGERGSQVAKNFELPSCQIRIRYLGRSDTRLELVEFSEPATIGDGSRRPGNAIGAFMLGYQVEDVRSAAKKLVELGGTLVLESKSGAQQNHEMIMMADPDGFRIELTSMPMPLIKPLFGQ